MTITGSLMRIHAAAQLGREKIASQPSWPRYLASVLAPKDPRDRQAIANVRRNLAGLSRLFQNVVPGGAAPPINRRRGTLAMAFSIFDERILEGGEFFFDDSYTPGDFTIITPSTNPRRIDECQLGNADSIDHVVNLVRSNGTLAVPFASVVVPAGAGTAGAPTIDAVALQASAQIGGFPQPEGFNIQWSVAETILSGGFVTLHWSGGQF